MILRYAILTREYPSGLFSNAVYVLNFLRGLDNINLNEKETINDGKLFDNFDEGVVFLGSLGYNLCSAITVSSSRYVEKGWFSKKIEIV